MYNHLAFKCLPSACCCNAAQLHLPSDSPGPAPSPRARTTYLRYHCRQMLLRQAMTQSSDAFRRFELKNANQSNGEGFRAPRVERSSDPKQVLTSTTAASTLQSKRTKNQVDLSHLYWLQWRQLLMSWKATRNPSNFPNHGIFPVLMWLKWGSLTLELPPFRQPDQSSSPSKSPGLPPAV